jgi:transcriptional regulator with XRE-family HTH domain
LKTADIFKENLRKLRKEKFPRQEDFYPLVGFESVRGYQKYEQGESAPTPDILDRFAEVLGCEPWSLVTPDISNKIKELQGVLEKQTKLMLEQAEAQVGMFKRIRELEVENLQLKEDLAASQDEIKSVVSPIPQAVWAAWASSQTPKKAKQLAEIFLTKNMELLKQMDLSLGGLRAAEALLRWLYSTKPRPKA